MRKRFLVLILSALLGLAACGGGGSEFVGQWEGKMPSSSPFNEGPSIVYEITHNTGNQYYITASRNGKQLMGGKKSVAIYKDGLLELDTGGKATVDKKTGKLDMAGMVLTRVK